MNKNRWILTALVITLCSAEAVESLFEQPTSPPPANEIDRLVFAELATLNIQPKLCSDAVFIRRVYLDVIGKLPTAEEAKAFIDAPRSNNKRSELIETLLERSEFADYWSMKWGDVLRIKAEFPVNLWPNAAQAYHHWVRTSIAENKPYDQFAREMLTASGSNFRVGEVNFYRALQNKTPEGIASAVALTFMGARAESWPDNRLQKMAAFFSQVGYKPTNEWKEENVFWDPLGSTQTSGNSAPGSAVITTLFVENNTNPPPANISMVSQNAVFPDDTTVMLNPNRDPRAVFSDWLITPENPWFSRSIANRVWAWLLGRGIVQEPDDIRDDNPPSNPALLNWLADELVANHYDLKHLYRLILNSKTYQLSSVSNTESPKAAAQFAAYPLRRLDAEVLIDAINDITGSSDLYTSAIPEPFTYIPKGQSAVSIADGSIISPFLALFGRSARATGMANERNNKATPPQWMHMLNSGHIQEKLEKGPNIRNLTAARNDPKQIIDSLYLTILSRHPTKEEVETARAYGDIANPKKMPRRPAGKLSKAEKKKFSSQWSAANQERMNDWTDIAWALINSPEFLYRH